MIAMKKTVLMLLSAVLILSSPGWAKPLNPRQVPAEAKWLVHVDFNMFAESETWDLISQEISDKNQKKIDAITTLFGSDPTKDLFGVTLFGSDANEENAVAIINGRFNRKKLLALLALNEAYAETEYNGQILYHWVDERDNKAKVGIFATESLIVISQSEPPVQSMVDLLAGKADSLANQPTAPFSALTKTPQGAIMVMAAGGLTQLRRDDKQNVFLQNSKTIVVFAGEKQGEMFLNANLTTDTPEAAMQIEQALIGMKAFVAMNHAEQPEMISLLQAIILKRNENQLSLTAKYPAAKLLDIFKEKFQPKNKDQSVEPSN